MSLMQVLVAGNHSVPWSVCHTDFKVRGATSMSLLLLLTEASISLDLTCMGIVDTAALLVPLIFFATHTSLIVLPNFLAWSKYFFKSVMSFQDISF